jgi:hypothetical protein
MPYNAQNGDGAQALDQNLVLEARRGNAWKSGVDASASNGDMTVDLTSGELLIGGDTVSLAADTVTIPSADADQPRKDLIYADSSGFTVATGSPGVKEPSSNAIFETFNPAPPDATAVSGTPLWEVWVPAGASEILTEYLRDRRISADASFGALDTEELSYGANFETALPGEVQTVINNVESAGGGVVQLNPSKSYDPGSAWNVKPGVVLDCNWARINLSTDTNVFNILSGTTDTGSVKNAYVDTTGITYTSVVVELDTNFTSNKYLNKTVITGALFGTNGNGTAVKFTESKGSGILWATADLHIDGFDYGVHLETTTSGGFINSNEFRGTIKNTGQAAIAVTDSGGQEISSNIFHTDIQPEASTSIYGLEFNGGNKNTHTGKIWDPAGFVGAAVIWRSGTGSYNVSTGQNHTSIQYANNSSGDLSNRIIPVGYQRRFDSGAVSHDHVAASDDTFGTNDQITTSVTFNQSFNTAPRVYLTIEGGAEPITTVKNLNSSGFDLVSRNYMAADIGARTIHWLAVERIN